MKKIISLLILFVFCGIANASLSVKPSRVEVRMERNDVFESQYELINNYDGDVNLSISAEDWHSYKGNAGITPDQWLKITPSNVTMKKGEKINVAYAIHTTSGMQGTVAAQVSFSLNPPGNDGLTVKMSFPIYVNIYGTENIEFEIKKIAFYEVDGNIKAGMTIENRGNVNVRPEGKVDIYNSKNKLVHTSVFKQSLPVYTGTERDGFGPAMPVKLEPGKYTAEAEVSAQGKSVKKKAKFRIKSDGTLMSQ